MKLFIRNKNYAWRIRRRFLYLIYFAGTFSACEMSNTIPYEFEQYKPVLIIHGVASPQSGGVVLIRYNNPLYDLKGMIPDLPALKVNLLSENNQIQSFTLDSITMDADYPDRNIQKAIFRISADTLELVEGSSYSLEVLDIDNGIRYNSNMVRLPEKPKISQLDVNCENDARANCFINLDLGSVNGRVSAITLGIKPPDSILQLGVDPIYDLRIFDNITWPDIDNWTTFSINSTFSKKFRTGQDSEILLPIVNLHVAFISHDLSILLREIHESYPPGEDIFANPRPFHSNFNKAAGVFGLYNEKIRIIEL